MNTPALFTEARLGLEEAIELTVASLNAYRAQYDHWLVGFSGGKDSTATVTLLAYLIQTGRVTAPKSLKVIYADTGMELPPLHASALGVLAELRRRGWATEVVKPALDQRFFVYMFGRGVPPPSPTFRYCTGILKINPIQDALMSHAHSLGLGEVGHNERGQKTWRSYGQGKLLSLTGVRLGESAVRDARIILSCSKDSGECGQGYLQKTTPEALSDVLAPLVHWRVCHIWDWLMLYQKEHGFNTGLVAAIYGVDDENSTAESDARTGCIQCNVARKDTAFDNVLRRPEWAYLRPLKGLRPLYAELREPRHRLRKVLERNAAGALVANQGRLGPLTMAARDYGLDVVVKMQAAINAARPAGQPVVSLIDFEELVRIHELMEANTWPDKWTGAEPTGDAWLPTYYADGTAQELLFD